MPENLPKQLSKPLNQEEFTKSMKILVVDDEESLRGMLSETLGDAGFFTDTAESGEAALEKFKDTDFNIVLSDIRMPGISGIDLIEKLKATHPDTEVVIMTSHASMDTAIRAIRTGAYDYLLKPFNNLDEVVALVNRVAEKLFLFFENRRLIRDLAQKNEELVETNKRVVDKNKETQTLYNFSKFLTQTLEMNEVMKLSLSCFSQLGEERTALFLAYLQGKLVLTQTHPDSRLDDVKMKALLSLESMRLTDILEWFHKINLEPTFQKMVSLYFQTDSFFASPLFVNKKPFGILVSLGNENEQFPPKIARLLNQFSQMVAVAVDNAFLHKQMKDHAIKDGLTGLFNHRYFQERLASEIPRADRHAHPVSLIFLDVDHFKIFNDTNGHPMGDMVLRGVANLISGKSRKSDIVARYGGEEFVIILPETPLDGAIKMAEELRLAIETQHFPCEENQPMGKLTTSLGVAEFPRDAKSVKELIGAADTALYASKEGGRNRVTGYEKNLSQDDSQKTTNKPPKVQKAPA